MGVSFDTQEENAAFAEKFHFPYPLLCDTGREMGMAYGACNAPDAKHASRISYWIGTDGTVRKAYPKVDPSSHVADVLSDLAG